MTLKISKEELANFSNCTVNDIENAISMGFEFKTLSDSAYLIEDTKKLKSSILEYRAFLKWKKDGV